MTYSKREPGSGAIYSLEQSEKDLSYDHPSVETSQGLAYASGRGELTLDRITLVIFDNK